MKVGIVLPMNDADSPGAGAWTRVRELARFAEAGGIDSLWVYDHFIFRMAGEPDGVLFFAPDNVEGDALRAPRPDGGQLGELGY